MTIELGDPILPYTFSKRSVYFGNRRWSRGVTTVIKKLFASSYTYQKLTMKHMCSRGLRQKQAKRRGQLIDTVVGKWVNGHRIKCRTQEPTALIHYFERNHWKPVSSQLVVAYPTARLATKIDVVLYDTVHDTLLIVEVKSGYHYRKCSTLNGTLKFVRPIVSNCPLHQHQLQALLGKWLFLETYPQWTNRKVEAVVVYVSSDGECEVYMERYFTVLFSDTIKNVLINTA